MKRSSIFIVLFTLFVCFGTLRALEAAPQLEVPGGISFDFGDVQPNQTLTHNFVFKNHGDSTLNILKAKGGWGCDVKLLDGNEVPAGGEARVAVNVRTGNRRRNIRQVVKVQTNDPEQAAFSLTLRANVLVDVDVLPNNVLRFSREQAESASLTLKNYSKNPVQLSGIDSSVSHVNISLSSMTIPPEGEVQISGTLLPDTPKGTFSGWLKITTDLKTLPLIQVRIWGNVE